MALRCSVTGMAGCVLVTIVGSALAQPLPAPQAPPSPDVNDIFGRFSRNLQDVSTWTVPTSDRAIAQCQVLLHGLIDGFNEAAWTRAAVRLITSAPHESVPMFSVAGEPVWEVRLAGQRIATPTYRALGKFGLRDIRVLITPWGNVLRLEIVNSQSGRVATSEPSGDSYAAQRLNVGPEVWRQNPNKPRISLAEAIETAQQQMGGLAEAAKIICIFVDFQIANKKGIFPAWSIDVRGTTPIPGSRPDIPEQALDHVRHIVNADTGKWVMATSVPQPDPVAPAKPAQPDGKPAEGAGKPAPNGQPREPEKPDVPRPAIGGGT